MYISIFNPMEQFTVKQIWGSFFTGQNNLTVFLWLLTIVIIAWVSFSRLEIIVWPQNSTPFYPFLNVMNGVLNSIFYFVESAFSSEYDDRTGEIFLFNHFIVIFFLIILSNYLGIMPLFEGLTATMQFPWFLALTIFIANHLYIFYRHGIKFLDLFYVPFVSIYMALLIALIEFFTHMLKSFSLFTRLFANMFSGHMLFSIIGDCILWSGTSASSAAVFIVTPFVIILSLAIFTLELFVCFMQTYVFLLLTTIYFGSALGSDH